MKTISISADRSTVIFDGSSYPGTSTPWDPDNSSGAPTRPLHDPAHVVYSTNADGSQGKPYMPRRYPSGTWTVTGIQTNDENVRPDLGPIVITTDAHQTVRVWALDSTGGYDHETGETVEDYAYEIHHDSDPAEGDFTMGCQHITSRDDMITLGAAVQAALGEGVQVVAT